jgi:putative holliday junction resolvase
VRVLGLDLGTKTIGVAVSDELGMLAHPRTTIARRGTKPDVEAVAQLLAKEEATGIVIGLPLDLRGKVGRMGRLVLAFIEALRVRLPTIPVTTWDERFTTSEAERILIEADYSRARRKGVIDQAAAVQILQAYLDAQKHPDRPGVEE